MKKLSVLILMLMLLLSGCSAAEHAYDIAATTLPVYDFTAALCLGTDLQVGRLVTENISCLHDYTLQVDQMWMLESADAVVISGAGLEDFLDDALRVAPVIIDASTGVHLHSGSHAHEHHDDHRHSQEQDPHIWLSPENAAVMAQNICVGLSGMYPQYEDTFYKNLETLQTQLDALREYADRQMADIPCRELITFHDGFSYFAESFDLTILEAIEEESGSEASAAEIIHLIQLVESHRLPAIFTEKSGSDACAGIISKETGAIIYTLDMAMSGDSYFDAMYHNIDTIREALK